MKKKKERPLIWTTIERLKYDPVVGMNIEQKNKYLDDLMTKHKTTQIRIVKSEYETSNYNMRNDSYVPPTVHPLYLVEALLPKWTLEDALEHLQKIFKKAAKKS